MPTASKAALNADIEVASQRFLAARTRLLRVGLLFTLAYWLLVGWSLQQSWNRTLEHSLDSALQASRRIADRVELSFDLARAVFVATDITLEQVPDPYTVKLIVKPMAQATLHVFDSVVLSDPLLEHQLAIRPEYAAGSAGELPICPAPTASLASGQMQLGASGELLMLRYKLQHGWAPDLWLCAKLVRRELNDFFAAVSADSGLQLALLDPLSVKLLGQSPGWSLAASQVQELQLLEPLDVAAQSGAQPPQWHRLPAANWLDNRQLLLNRLPGAPLLVIVQVSNRALLASCWQQVKWLLPLSVVLMLVLVLAYVGSLRFIRALDFAATHDVLTQLYNRRHLLELALQVQSMSKRLGSYYAVVLVDVDHFKHVNDRFGHAAGDTVLQGLAMALQQGGRKSDLVGRYGGEEFALVLPVTDAEGARLAVERLRLAVAKRVFSVGEQVLAVTISLGFIADDGSHRLEDLLNAADKALYQAKAAGRNCWVQAASLG